MKIQDSKLEELYLFQRFETAEDTNCFIIPYTIERHLEEFFKPDIYYKTIFIEDKIIGFIILRFEKDRESVEFRRIVINEKGRGFGIMAIQILDEIVKKKYKRNRIWLDVFAHNKRGIHVYEKCGYKYLKSVDYQGKELKIYEKML